MASMRNTPSDESNLGANDFRCGSQTLGNQAATSQCFYPQAVTDTLDYSNVRMSGCEDEIHDLTPVMCQPGPFTFSYLREMEFSAPSSDYTTQCTSCPYSVFVPEGVQISPPSLPLQPEMVCRLLAGQASQCRPQLCGPDASCQESSHLLALERPSVPYVIEKLPNRPYITHSSHLPPASIVETVRSRPSIYQPKKQSTNSWQRLQREELNAANVRSHSKKAHSLVERRYRENLNSTIAQLHLTLMKTKRAGSNMPENQHKGSQKHQQDLPKMCKGKIMLEAVAYVDQTEVELRHMADEIELLTTRVRELEKLVKREDCSHVAIGFDVYAG
jgi:Helix-loop-helix DNA-binding domain